MEETFALPRRLTDAGIRRYGFHGLSYEYIASKLPEVDRRAAEGRTVVAHLGSGASMCALQAGRSVATTMSFTALDGLPMGTRSGSIDPGVLLYLMDEYEMDARSLERLLYQESGLLSTCSFIALAGNWGCWLRRSADWMHSSSRRESGKTPQRFARRSAGPRPGWAWSWTKQPTKTAVHGSVFRKALYRPGSSPPMKS